MSTQSSSGPCEVCEEAPSGQVEVTSNVGLFEVNGRMYITPICPEHDDLTSTEKVHEAYDYGGAEMVANLIDAGAVTRGEAIDALAEADSLTE